MVLSTTHSQRSQLQAPSKGAKTSTFFHYFLIRSVYEGKFVLLFIKIMFKKRYSKVGYGMSHTQSEILWSWIWVFENLSILRLFSNRHSRIKKLFIKNFTILEIFWINYEKPNKNEEHWSSVAATTTVYVGIPSTTLICYFGEVNIFNFLPPHQRKKLFRNFGTNRTYSVQLCGNFLAPDGPG